MTISGGIAPKAEAHTGQILKHMARWLAYAGGFVLTASAIMTVTSIIGRTFIWAGLSPVPGDFELVEIASVVAIFAFLPWGQINRGQVSVDILVDYFPSRLRAALGMLGDAALTLAATIIAWRLWLGFGERFPYGSDLIRDLFALGEKPFYVETTFILRMPVWVGYALSMIGASFFAVVCFYTLWRAINWTLRGQEDVIL